jgi:hypothetical protein
LEDTGTLWCDIKTRNTKIYPHQPNFLKRAGGYNSGIEKNFESDVCRDRRMSFSEKVLADPDAQYLFRGFEKLSDEGKHALKTYIKLLEMEDKKKKRK